MARTDGRFRETYNALLTLCAELGPGQALPAENALAERAGVSRTVVRGALQRLSDAGIVRWRGREKTLLRRPEESDRLPVQPQAPDADELESRFLDWVLRFDVPAGTSLNVAQLSRQFAVPPHTLQEFLAGLSRSGLVERRARGGWRLLGFTADYALELSEFRGVLELNAIRHLLALPEGHPVWQRLEALRRDHLDLLERLDTDFHDFSRLDERFHTTVNSVVRNRFVREFQKIVALIFHYHYMWDKTEERQRNGVAIGEHVAIIDGLLARDGSAAEAAALRHLSSSKQTLQSSLRGNGLV
ncbi:MAG: GntR family transcriptional regulator [Amaricoccus sp.]|uniref:GntR family transcriptional regulator n=1 Tax=Amaricoccus sp. TaxID=1872485 RepID=UPI0039E45A69